MNDTRYEPGEIDAILRKADDNPPVHPHLIEHLREKFAIKLPTYLMGTGDCALQWVSRGQGQQEVIDYLATLVNPGQGVPEEENQRDELPRTEAESAGSDPRRPRTRERG